MAGLAKRASQVGAIVGLDWAGVNVVLPKGDRERMIALLACWEGGMVAGSVKRAERDAARTP